MNEFLNELFKVSPTIASVGIVWYMYKKDKEKIEDRYENFVKEVREDSKEREFKYQETIDKLVDKIDVVDDIRKDVTDIKEKLNEQSKKRAASK